jgi:cobalt-zinc-cadmium efflux system outer membrane protein
MKYIINFLATTYIFVVLIGCTSVPKDLGRSDVDTIVSERGLPISSEPLTNQNDLVKTLIAEPLTAESAIRIALVNNPTLKVSYAGLGIAAADVYQAGRIRNPIFSFISLDTNASGERNQTTFGLITSFTDLITLPARKRFAEAEFTAKKQSISAEVLAVAIEAEAAFYNFVASKQFAALHAQIAKAGELSLGLAKRYYVAGNLTPRELALEHATASEFKLAALEAEANAYAKRVELATVLGISVADEWDSPAHLPVPLEQEDELALLLRLAKQSRLDLVIATARTDILADRLGVTNWTRWLGELDVGIEHERDTDRSELTGPVFEWEVPIFTQNRDRKLRASAELQIAIAEVQRLTIALENDVRFAYTATLNTKARVKEYRERLIPARIETVARAQEEENFMLIGTFELLTTKQQEYDAYQGYLEVVRDYWLARTELARAVGNTLPSSAQVGEEHLDVEEYLTPKTSGTGHSGHVGMDMKSSEDEGATTSTDHSQHDMKNDLNEKEIQHEEHNAGQAGEVDHSDHNMENSSSEMNIQDDEHDAHSHH